MTDSAPPRPPGLSLRLRAAVGRTRRARGLRVLPAARFEPALGKPQPPPPPRAPAPARVPGVRLRRLAPEGARAW